MIPVRGRGNDDLLEVVKYPVERLARFGRLRGQRGDHVAGANVGHHPVPLGVLVVVADPLADALEGGAQLVRPFHRVECWRPATEKALA